MLRTNFLQETDVRKVIKFNDKYSVVEYTRDVSNSPSTAQVAYFMATMNVRKRQLAICLNDDSTIVQAGAMQWFGGNVRVETDVKGVGDFAKKLVGASVTKETAIKPKYTGTGIVVLEPTYKYLLQENVENWQGGLVIQDGLFLACDSTVRMQVVARRNVSSAMLGGEGLFNTCLSGRGTVILESNVPTDELVVVNLENDELKVDGSFAIAWTNTLQFTVERTTSTLIGSAASGEGLVNVYRGTGKVILAPVAGKIMAGGIPTSQV